MRWRWSVGTLGVECRRQVDDEPTGALARTHSEQMLVDCTTLTANSSSRLHNTHSEQMLVDCTTLYTTTLYHPPTRPTVVVVPGSFTWKVQPSPSPSLSAQIRPPWSSTMPLAMKSPNPLPPPP